MVASFIPTPPMTISINAGYGRNNYVNLRVCNSGDNTKTVAEMSTSTAKKLIKQLQSIVGVIDV